MKLRVSANALNVALPNSVSLRVLRFKLITPMIGGGVKPKILDRKMPVRTSAIRGQLRWWWRILRSSGYWGRAPEPLQLLNEECAIWGGAVDHKAINGSSASNVRLHVELMPDFQAASPGAYYTRNKEDSRLKVVLAASQGAPLCLVGKKTHSPGVLYGYFTLFNEQPEIPANAMAGRQLKTLEDVASNLEFDLSCNLTNLDKNQTAQVNDVIDIFGLFGSLGGRSRRGAGALECKNGVSVERCAAILENLKKCGFVTKRLSSEADQTALGALNAGLVKYKNFRQARRPRLNADQSNRPGRSYWPEPETIRYLTDSRLGRHDRLDSRIAPQSASEAVFPRATFGLPIVFHFQRDRSVNNDRRNDPIDCTLELTALGKKRFSSPLLLRPFRLPAGDYVCLALVMPEAFRLGQQLVSNKLALSLVPKGKTPIPVADTAAYSVNLESLELQLNLAPENINSALQLFIDSQCVDLNVNPA
jgi:CRISPR-associated protein Cmr1